MNRKNNLTRRRRARLAGGVVLTTLLAFLLVFPFPASVQTPPPAPATIFELELPELGVTPTAQPELTIPTANVTTVVLHVLRPQSDNIDYGQIGAHVNGQSAGLITEIVSGERGKMLRVNLKRYPGYGLVDGRNTVEVLARNKRGREFYASFVLRTATENRNQDFVYQIAVGQDLKQQVPPELVLLEPEREVELPPGRKTQKVRITGVATAVTSITSVTINGEPAVLKRGEQVATRGLGLSNEGNRVSFDALFTPTAATREIIVAATDAQGNRTQLKIPVRVAAPAKVADFTGRKYALLIGISKYRHRVGNLSDLRYADADAVALHKFLQTPAGGRFAPENMLLLTNEEATTEKVRGALMSFVTQPGPEDLIVIFLASHGGPDQLAQQNLYFVTHDTHLGRMSETAIAMKDFQRLLEQNVRARRMVTLVDTCHSAGLTVSPGVMMRGLGNNLINLYVEKLLYREEGKAVMTSSDVNELSAEGPLWGGGHGVFTHFVLEGMRGRADTNADRLVTVGELFRFVRQRVRTDTKYSQNPRMLIGTNENLALAAVPAR